MESNRDEARKALELARQKLNAGDLSGAKRLALKSQKLYPSKEAEAILNSTGNSSESTKKLTAEQEIKRIKKCPPTDYYEILQVQKTADEQEIRKSYKRLALQLHPDKTKAADADEAFKMVSRAFQILSDVDKRKTFDLRGTDPDIRHQPDVNAEDIFNMFFNGNSMFFQGNPMFSQFGQFGQFSQFGGPNASFRFYQQPRQRRNTETTQSLRDLIVQYLPLIILLVLGIIPNLLSSTSSPSFRFHPESPYIMLKNSNDHHVDYYVDPRAIQKMSSNDIRKLERQVESQYLKHLRMSCDMEWENRKELMNDAYGWFGRIDYEALESAKNMPLPSCERLSQW